MSDFNLDYLAHLSRLQLTAAEKQRYAQQIGNILVHIEKLLAVDTSSVEPTAHALPIVNQFRQDTEGSVFSSAEFEQACHSVVSGQICVPRIVGE